MRIFRTCFFLGALALLMPSPPEGQKTSAQDSEVTTPQMVYAATRTVSDLGDFCGRQPMVCDTTGFIATKLEAKAKYGIELLYEWANEASSTTGQQAGKVDETAIGSLPKFAGATDQPSQNTLKVEDLIPAWRDPARVGKS